MKRIFLVLSLTGLLVAMLAATVGTAFAQVERGECLPDIPCRQGVLLPDEPKGNLYNGFGQGSSACPALDITQGPIEAPGTGTRPERSFEMGGQAPENVTVPFHHCFEGPEPIVNE